MLNVSRGTNYIQGESIDSFLGQRQSQVSNILKMPTGQLLFNQNMEYVKSGNIFLKTRKGSTLTKDITIASVGSADYVYDFDSNYFTWVNQEGELNYYDENTDIISVIRVGLSATYNEFFMYGLSTLSSLYGGNSIDGVYKVSGSVPTFSLIAGSPLIVSIAFGTLSGRAFGVYKHTVYWTDIQSSAVSLANLETWNTATNNAVVSPDNGSGFTKVIDFGDALFFFKDSGVWALPNSEEATTEWMFPQMDAETGSKSPKTVALARVNGQAGIIYLGTDKTLRFFNARVIRNAGTKPTVEGGDASIISYPFQAYLDDISDGSLAECNAVYYDNAYVLNISSLGSSDLTVTLVIRTDLVYNNELVFWYVASGMNIKNYVKRNNSLFGFSKDAYISELFVANTYSDEVPTRIDSSGTIAIPWSFYTAWIKVSKNQVEAVKGYLNWRTDGNWAVTFSLNAFTFGDSIPAYNEGLTASVPNQSGTGGYWGIGSWGSMLWSTSTGERSQRFAVNNKGNYFIFGVSNSNKNEWASIYSIEPIYKTIRLSPIGKR